MIRIYFSNNHKTMSSNRSTISSYLGFFICFLSYELSDGSYLVPKWKPQKSSMAFQNISKLEQNYFPVICDDDELIKLGAQDVDEWLESVVNKVIIYCR